MTINREPGPWPSEFPITADGKVTKGLVVWSLSGEIEGRTTGARMRCQDPKCPGWFIGVQWETGQNMRVCSQGWKYVPETNSVKMEGAREISSTSTTIPDRRQPPLPRSEWPDRSKLGPAWRVDRPTTGTR